MTTRQDQFNYHANLYDSGTITYLKPLHFWWLQIHSTVYSTCYVMFINSLKSLL